MLRPWRTCIVPLFAILFFILFVDGAPLETSIVSRHKVETDRPTVDGCDFISPHKGCDSTITKIETIFGKGDGSLELGSLGGDIIDIPDPILGFDDDIPDISGFDDVFPDSIDIIPPPSHESHGGQSSPSSSDHGSGISISPPSGSVHPDNKNIHPVTSPSDSGALTPSSGGGSGSSGNSVPPGPSPPNSGVPTPAGSSSSSDSGQSAPVSSDNGSGGVAPGSVGTPASSSPSTKGGASNGPVGSAPSGPSAPSTSPSSPASPGQPSTPVVGSPSSPSQSSASTGDGSTSPTPSTTFSASPTTEASPTGASGSSGSNTPNSSAAQASSSGTPTAAQSTGTQTPFVLPGQKLQVLPIGLGVFAGISVIALIVVGLVTYERTKYRKAFRQRRLAEQGQMPSYGGMAERAT